MKKSLLIGIILLCFSALFADSKSGVLPEGRELLPILWKYASEEPSQDQLDSSKGVLESFVITMDKINPIDNEYTFTKEIIYCRRDPIYNRVHTQFFVKQDGNNFSVEALETYFGICDKQGNFTADTTSFKGTLMIEQNDLVKLLAQSAKEMSDSEYQKWYDAAYYNIAIQDSIQYVAANKLKAKQWYSAHSMIGKKTSIEIITTNIDESERKGFSYKVAGKKEKINVEFHTNDDAYIDVTERQRIVISGTVADVTYSDTDGYHIESIIIENK